MRFLSVLLLLLMLWSPAWAITEEQATDIVVNTLRMRLQRSQRCLTWSELYTEWWTVYDLRPYTGFF